MFVSHTLIKPIVVSALISMTCFVMSAAAQNASSPIDTASSQFHAPKLSISGKTYALTPPAPGTIETETKPVPRPTPGTASTSEKPVPASTPGDVQSEIEAVKAENAAVREMLRNMEANQKALLEQVDKLQKRLDGTTATTLPPAGDIDPLSASVSSIPPAGTVPVTQPGAPIGKQAPPERYQDGIIIWKTPNDALIPFLLKFNDDTQLRYLNTMAGDDTFTDHLGVVRDVHARNDITVNRSMFNINGYMFSPRLGYSLKVWTSAGAASIVVAGNISWTFSRKLTLVAGYTGLPGSRSLVATFPFFQAIDRSMADNFFRPGFTQGLWAFGQPIKHVTYQVMVGNGLNTLGVSANKIDTGLALAGSVWWEPLGEYGPTGKSAEMYDDYLAPKKLRLRLGTSFTRSREDRFSNLDVSSPENTALHNSDGVLTFSTGAFAKGVTLQKALYKMWAADWGLKYHGFSVNGQYFARWLSEFEADGPIPETSTFDHGFEVSAGHFVIKKKLELYGRGSMVFGQFRNSSEVGGGVRWYFLPTERLWMNGEILRVNHSPYGGAFTPYTAGMNAWVPMIQTVLAF